MQSICDQLLFEKASGHRELRNLKFVWIERDPVLVQQVSFLKNKQDENSNKRDSSTNSALYGQTSESIVSTLMSLLPPGDTSDADLEEQYADGGLPIDDSSLVIRDDNHEVSTCSRRPPQWIIFDNPDHTPNPMPKKDAVLDLQVYLTGNAKPTGPVPFARLGRPDINALFDEMRRDALTSGDKKVAVCVSAPHKLMSLCHRACVLYSDDKVRFDYHCEAMAI